MKIPQQKFDFLTFEELSRLTEAVKIDPERWALVLLGADAGLRQGEIIALEWGDVDLVAGALTVRRSSWKGQVGSAQQFFSERRPGARNRSCGALGVRVPAEEFEFELGNRVGEVLRRRSCEAVHTRRRAWSRC